MKKNILKVFATIVIALVAVCNIYISHNKVELSDLALANVEALAYGDEGGFEAVCGRNEGKCWMFDGYCYSGEHTYKKCIRTEDLWNYCVRGC